MILNKTLIKSFLTSSWRLFIDKRACFPLGCANARLAFEGIAELQGAHPTAAATWYDGLSCVVDGIATNPAIVDNAKTILEEMIMQVSILGFFTAFISPSLNNVDLKLALTDPSLADGQSMSAFLQGCRDNITQQAPILEFLWWFCSQALFSLSMQGKPVTSAMSDCVIAAAGQVRDPNRAFHLFDAFAEIRLGPTTDTYAAVLWACISNGLLESVPMVSSSKHCCIATAVLEMNASWTGMCRMSLHKRVREVMH